MKKLLLVAVAALFAVPALAADLPVKVKRRDVAPPNPFVYPSASGPYAFVGTEGGAGSANVTVPGLNSNSITTTTIDVHIGAGYVWSMPNGAFAGFEGRIGWQNFNGDTQGFSFSGPLALEQTFYFGIPFAQLQTVLPINIFGGLTPPPFSPPPGTTVSTTNWALGLTLDERDISLNFGDAANRDWAFAPGVKLVQQNLLSNGLMAEVGGKIRFDHLGACVGPSVIGSACASLGTSYLAVANFKFGI